MAKRAEAKPLRACNVCGIPLMTVAEAAIGVHIACVAEAKRHSLRRIPRPSYGRSGEPSNE